MWHISTGKIIYDPHRPGLNNTKWWCVVNVDREITRYYRWWIEKELHIKELKQPSWDAHISVVRGARDRPTPELAHLWKKYHGEVVEFKYKHCPRVSGDTTNDRPNNFWFVEVECPKLIQIRQELERPSDWKLHLTVGRTWY